MGINFRKMVRAKKGFTLIELLVVTAIIGVLAIISAIVFNSILRSQNKTTIVNEVRQNGNLVIDKFERDIRGARFIEFDEDDDEIITVQSVNSSIVWLCDGDNLLRRGENLLNRDPHGGVKLVDCRFNVTSSQPQLVLFNFTLEQRNQAQKAEFESKVEFQTTISTRAY